MLIKRKSLGTWAYSAAETVLGAVAFIKLLFPSVKPFPFEIPGDYWLIFLVLLPLGVQLVWGKLYPTVTHILLYIGLSVKSFIDISDSGIDNLLKEDIIYIPVCLLFSLIALIYFTHPDIKNQFKKII